MLARTAAFLALAAVVTFAPEASARDRFGIFLGPNGFAGYYQTGGNTFAVAVGGGYGYGHRHHASHYPAPVYHAPAYYAPPCYAQPVYAQPVYAPPVYAPPPVPVYRVAPRPTTVINNYYYGTPAPQPAPVYAETYYR